MSEYGRVQTEYNDKDCLIAALGEMGYDKSVIEDHTEAQQLYDFRGRATKYLDATGDKAHLIVRRNNVGGAANDLGFQKTADGTYSAIISQYDTGKHNTKWLTGLRRSYTEKRAAKEAARIGAKLYNVPFINEKGKKVVQYLVS